MLIGSDHPPATQKMNILEAMTGICVCVLVSGLCRVPYYEVVRIFQHGLQPYAAATPVLDSGCPHAFFKPDDEVCMPMTRYNITHRLLYNIYE